jgi:hypothetical protein
LDPRFLRIKKVPTHLQYSQVLVNKANSPNNEKKKFNYSLDLNDRKENSGKFLNFSHKPVDIIHKSFNKSLNNLENAKNNDNHDKEYIIKDDSDNLNDPYKNLTEDFKQSLILADREDDIKMNMNMNIPLTSKFRIFKNSKANNITKSANIDKTKSNFQKFKSLTSNEQVNSKVSLEETQKVKDIQWKSN